MVGLQAMSADRAPTQGMVRLVEANDVLVRIRKAVDVFESVNTKTRRQSNWQPDTEKEDMLNEGQRKTVEGRILQI